MFGFEEENGKGCSSDLVKAAWCECMNFSQFSANNATDTNPSWLCWCTMSMWIHVEDEDMNKSMPGAEKKVLSLQSLKRLQFWNSGEERLFRLAQSSKPYKDQAEAASVQRLGKHHETKWLGSKEACNTSSKQVWCRHTSSFSTPTLAAFSVNVTAESQNLYTKIGFERDKGASSTPATASCASSNNSSTWNTCHRPRGSWVKSPSSATFLLFGRSMIFRRNAQGKVAKDAKGLLNTEGAAPQGVRFFKASCNAFFRSSSNRDAASAVLTAVKITQIFAAELVDSRSPMPPSTIWIVSRSDSHLSTRPASRTAKASWRLQSS